MSIITDGLLIATCLTAALYCIVLSRRLARFADTESGIGKQISQLNAILEETRASTKETQTGAKSVSDRLSRDLAGAKKASHDLAAMIERAEAMLDRALELQEPRKKQGAEPLQTASPVVREETKADADEPVEQTPVAPEAKLSPVEEETLDDIAERDFDLADARGEPQLGFLPNVADTTAMPDLSLEEDQRDESTSADSGSDDDENLLKVERMAL